MLGQGLPLPDSHQSLACASCSLKHQWAGKLKGETDSCERPGKACSLFSPRQRWGALDPRAWHCQCIYRGCLPLRDNEMESILPHWCSADLAAACALWLKQEGTWGALGQEGYQEGPPAITFLQSQILQQMCTGVLDDLVCPSGGNSPGQGRRPEQDIRRAPQAQLLCFKPSFLTALSTLTVPLQAPGPSVHQHWTSQAFRVWPRYFLTISPSSTPGRCSEPRSMVPLHSHTSLDDKVNAFWQVEEGQVEEKGHPGLLHSEQVRAGVALAGRKGAFFFPLAAHS